MSNGTSQLALDTIALSKRISHWESFDAKQRRDIIELIRDAEELREAGKISDELFYFAVKAAISYLINREIETHFSDYIVRRFYPKVREIVETGAFYTRKC